jgi:cbb3-type cytochrome oxidase subunit 3
MDVNTLRVAVMIAGFVLFLALMAHTWSKKRRHDHEEAAMLPFRSDTESDLRPSDNRGEKP